MSCGPNLYLHYNPLYYWHTIVHQNLHTDLSILHRGRDENWRKFRKWVEISVKLQEMYDSQGLRPHLLVFCREGSGFSTQSHDPGCIWWYPFPHKIILPRTSGIERGGLAKCSSKDAMYDLMASFEYLCILQTSHIFSKSRESCVGGRKGMFTTSVRNVGMVRSGLTATSRIIFICRSTKFMCVHYKNMHFRLWSSCTPLQNTESCLSIISQACAQLRTQSFSSLSHCITYMSYFLKNVYIWNQHHMNITWSPASSNKMSFVSDKNFQIINVTLIRQISSWTW